MGSSGVRASVNQRLLRELYEKINLYEYAPPYGIKRYLEKKTGPRVKSLLYSQEPSSRRL
jgi:hypothetical protein